MGQHITSVLLAFGMLLPSVSFASEQLFYYYDGKKVRLEVTNTIALRPRQGVEAKTIIAGVLGPAPRFKTRVLEEQRLWLIDLSTAPSQEDVLRLSKRLATHPAAEFAVPVFSVGREELVLLDEFIVKFKEHIPEVEIVQFNTSNAVIPARDGPQPGTTVLKVTERSKLNALEMANLYYEQGVAVYSQPQFLRISHR